MARLDAETSKAAQSNEELEKQKTQTQQEFEELKLKWQNQLAEKPISQYKEIFADQAKKHKREPWIWLGSAILTIAVFFCLFFWSPSWSNAKDGEIVDALKVLFCERNSPFSYLRLAKPFY